MTVLFYIYEKDLNKRGIETERALIVFSENGANLPQMSHQINIHWTGRWRLIFIDML